MEKEPKTKKQLLDELAALRKCVTDLELLNATIAGHDQLMRESEERYRFLFETSTQGILILKQNSTIQMANPAMMRLLGAEHIGELKGRSYLDFVHPDDRDESKARIAMMYRNARRTSDKVHRGQIFAPVREHRMLRLDGEALIVESTGVVFQQKGKAYLQGNFHDIRERKQAEEAQRKSEEKYRMFAETAHDSILTMDLDGVITYANQAAMKVTGGLNIVGRRMKDFILEDFIGSYERMLDARGKGFSETHSDEWPIRSPKDGSVIFFDINSSLLTDNGRPSGILIIARDVTNRKFAEEALRKSEKRYRDIFENAIEGIYQSTYDGRLLSVNSAMARICGYESPKDMVMSISDVSGQYYVNREDRVRFKKLMDSRGRTDNFEYEIRKKDGSRTWVSDNARAVRNDEGDLLYYEGRIQDIAKRRETEEALQKSERRLNDVIDFLPDATMAIDSERKVIVWNKAIERMTGVKAEDMIGKGDHEQIVPFYGEKRPHLMDLIWDDDQSIIDRYPRVVREGESISTETFCPALYGGRGAHVFAKVSPLHDQAGHIVGAIESIRDIEEHKRAEEALLQSEATLRSLFTAAPIGLCIMKDRTFHSANKAWFEWVGYAESEIIGQSTRMLYENEEEYERVGRELYTGLTERGLASVQTRLRRKDGVLRDAVVTAAPLQSGDLSLDTVVAVQDVTDYRQAVEELRENRRQLADIIEFLPDATLVIDKEGRVIAWNQAIETMTGIRKEDMIGKGNYEYAIPFYGGRRPIIIDLALHPDREMEKKYTAIQRIGDGLFGEAFTPNLPPGNVHLSATASVLRDSSGEIIAAIECIRDNTERKRLEENLNRAEKMEALGTLAGGVAHDLNNVLGVLVGYSELLAEKLPVGSPLRKYTDSILQSSVRAAAIIQDLLTLARRGVTVSEVFDLNGVIDVYLKTPEFERLKSYHPDVQIHTQLADGLLNVKGSPVHLNKTLMNLVSNAAEAIPGKGNVTIRTENRYLDHPLRGYDQMQEGEYVVLMVSDTGNGISDQDLGKIFEPFYTKKVMGRSGTGLGLSIVWGVVKDHHGYIDIQSQEGRGSTFSLYFPATREEPAEETKSVSVDAYQGRGESILVVDDVEAQRELAMSMLERLGYKVETVGSGEAAVDYLRQQEADLVVLDMIMDPGIDGLETFKRILRIRPQQKVIIVSGFAETERVRQAQKYGAGAFVKKPYHLGKIGQAIRHELDRRRDVI